MVENFVEKYIPARIQSQISDTLQQVLPPKALEVLAAYEKVRFGEMHAVILDDDGYPALFEKVKQLRFDISKMDFENYRGVRWPNEQLDVGPLGSDSSFEGADQEPVDQHPAVAKLNDEKDALGALAVGKATATKFPPGPASAEHRDAAAVVEEYNIEFETNYE